MPIPTTPVLFLRPATALADPYPDTVVLPRAVKHEDGADYEAELALIIGKEAKDVSEERALEYLAGWVSRLHTPAGPRGPRRLSRLADSQRDGRTRRLAARLAVRPIPVVLLEGL